MALVYRAHFAFAARPIVNSKGVNTSALYGFTQTLLDIISTQKPTHLGLAMDTPVPTFRHVEYPEYKAQREAMPEDLSFALPHISRMAKAFNIPLIKSDGFEADDLIGTLVRQAEQAGMDSYMVTPDKDFGQLVTPRTFIYKPSRMGEGIEIMGVPEVLAKWGVQNPSQVIDVLALWGDASDNIPGVPGIGEKTASKLIAQYGSVESLLEHTAELKGKLKENLESHREQALLSKRLATIKCDSPCEFTVDQLLLQKPDEAMMKELFAEFEFNSLGKRIFGSDFKVQRAVDSKIGTSPQSQSSAAATSAGEIFALTADDAEEVQKPEDQPSLEKPTLKTIQDVPHEYHWVQTAEQRASLIVQLRGLKSFCFDTETTDLDPREARLVGIAFSFAPHTGYYVSMPEDSVELQKVLVEFQSIFADESIEKVGHNLKFDLSILKTLGMTVRGKMFDTMIAHSLVEPERRHGMDYLSEIYLGYSPITRLIGEDASGQLTMDKVSPEKVAEYAAEDADVTWQLRALIEPMLRLKGQEHVFNDIESPLIQVLVDMECEGIRVDSSILVEISKQLQLEMETHESRIYELAGARFNLNSPKQLGEVLFDKLKIAGAPKKTKTGQYSTNEQVLQSLEGEHEIVSRLLSFREASKLKSTYADALPLAISSRTGRVHTSYNQMVTVTGRLNSQNPNLQNIPIRTEQGREIRKAFIPRDSNHILLSADYSQIELRIIAALAEEKEMIEAFRKGLDIHAATAARVYGVELANVSPEMRRNAKMVNFGIAYGISAFGLAQRLGIPRSEAASIISQYFANYPGIAGYTRQVVERAKKLGYVETVSGRRRYLRDINSANATVRGAAERNAINMPIQGTAADMIKLAMIGIHREFIHQNLASRMLLQVHDELVFDVPRAEEKMVREIVAAQMKNALMMAAPIEVEVGVGENWLEAH